MPPDTVRAWCEALGQPTFVGTSGRVFPVAMKASPLLRAWLAQLARCGVEFHTRRRWLGWDDGGRLLFAAPDKEEAVAADATVLALGGASWPTARLDRRLGSRCSPSVASPLPRWRRPTAASASIGRKRSAAASRASRLKRIALTFGETTVRGEALITAAGIEGGAIYALAAALRDAITAGGSALLHIDLRPDVSLANLAARLAKPRGKQSLSTFLRKAASLSPVEIGLLHEAAHAQLAELNPMALAALTKAVPVRLTAAAPIETAISTAGGVNWEAVDEHLMLRRCPGVFVAGEMLDWEAPTGGYLLQGCLATGALAGRGALEWLARRPTA